MSTHRFLHCRDCNAVHHITAFDRAPVFEMDGLEIRETAQNDRRAFLDLHLDHSIGELNSVEESRGEGGAFVDPMEVNYVEVTDGREFFTLRSFRKSIADPMSYEVLPRQLRLWDAVDGAGENSKRSSPQVPQRRYRGTNMDKGGGSWKARAPKPKNDLRPRFESHNRGAGLGGGR
jgi:hypothetical protein